MYYIILIVFTIPAHLFRGAVVRDQLGLGGDVDAVHVGAPHWGRRRRKVHLQMREENAFELGEIEAILSAAKQAS